MSTPEPEPQTPNGHAGAEAGGVKLLRDPSGAVFLHPPVMPEGELAPTLPVQAQVGLTEPDAKGRQWIVVEFGDDTISVRLRIPWQSAGQFGAALAQQLQMRASRAQVAAGPALLVPGRNMPRGMPPMPPGPGRNENHRHG